MDIVVTWVGGSESRPAADPVLHPALTVPTLALALGLAALPPTIALLALLGWIT